MPRDVMFSLYSSLLGIERQFCPESLGAMLEYLYIERGL